MIQYVCASLARARHAESQRSAELGSLAMLRAIIERYSNSGQVQSREHACLVLGNIMIRGLIQNLIK